MIDEADPGSLGRHHQVARHQPFLGPRVSDELRPDDRGAVSCREADAHVRIADLCGLDGEDDVAEEGKCRTEARRMAVDPGYDGLLAIEQGKDDALGLARGLAEALVDHRLHPGDVAPRAEGAPRAREHDHIGPRVIGRIAEDRRELRMKSGVDGIEFSGLSRVSVRIRRGARAG